MIVGTTGTGKTTLSNTLAAALTALHKAGEVDYWY
jgi:adenylate kinase family enzyme